MAYCKCPYGFPATCFDSWLYFDASYLVILYSQVQGPELLIQVMCNFKLKKGTVEV